MGIRSGLEGTQKVQSWSVSSLKFEKTPLYKTILCILQDEGKINSWIDYHGYQRKKIWSNRDNVIDEQLRVWGIRMWEKGIYLSDAIIRENGRRLQEALNSPQPDDEQSNSKFSQGWLYAFKKRHESQGEEGDTDRGSTISALPGLRHFASLYWMNEIFYADEFGLNYTAAPTSKIVTAPYGTRRN